MTPLEHAMVGVNGALALGLHRRHGWKIAAAAGAAAASPDWDGLTLLAGAALYDQAHRVWGHNLFACVAAGLLIGLLDYRLDLAARVGGWFVKLLRLDVPKEPLAPRSDFTRRGAGVWAGTAIVAALSHLPADMVVSGHALYGDWEVKLFWPLWDHGWVYPRIRWGDVGVTLIFAVGAALMLRRPRRVQPLAILTLAAVAAYCMVRPRFDA